MIPFQRIAPGEPISASDYNRLLETVEWLSRISAAPPLDCDLTGTGPAIRWAGETGNAAVVKVTSIAATDGLYPARIVQTDSSFTVGGAQDAWFRAPNGEIPNIGSYYECCQVYRHTDGLPVYVHQIDAGAVKVTSLTAVGNLFPARIVKRDATGPTGSFIVGSTDDAWFQPLNGITPTLNAVYSAWRCGTSASKPIYTTQIGSSITTLPVQSQCFYLNSDETVPSGSPTTLQSWTDLGSASFIDNITSGTFQFKFAEENRTFLLNAVVTLFTPTPAIGKYQLASWLEIGGPITYTRFGIQRAAVFNYNGGASPGDIDFLQSFNLTYCLNVSSTSPLPVSPYFRVVAYAVAPTSVTARSDQGLSDLYQNTVLQITRLSQFS